MKIYFILNKFLFIFKNSGFLIQIIYLSVLFHINLLLFYIKNTIQYLKTTAQFIFLVFIRNLLYL